ncbi:hypothetical protein D9M68_807800 [compost metagenome]
MPIEETASLAEQPKQPAPVKVTITKENGHWHAGTKHPKGAVISVSPTDAEAIVALKAGEIVKGGK